MIKFNPKPLNFQKHIQGIRALGIIGVLLFHAGYSFAQGGYLSVDIFFVISGFFMTIIILNIKENEGFFLKFYQRRIARIIPLSVFVITILTIASIKYFPTLYDFESIKSSLFFYSNFNFHNSSNYFQSFNDNIFLHFWSLSLEEQFYLIFPMFLFFLRKYFFNKILIIFISIIILNLMSINFLGNLSSNFPYIDKELGFYKPLEIFSFYFLTSRFWEFCLGGVAGILYLNETFSNNKIDFKKANLISFIGLLMVVFSQIIFDKSMPHPSIFTLIPCLGVFLIIVFSFKETFTYRFFSNQILVFIGNISFSLYLWHAPILIFQENLNLKNINPDISRVIAIFISVIISYLSYKLIENFFRRKENVFKTYIFILINFMLIMFIFFAVHYTKKIPLIMDDEFYFIKEINGKQLSINTLPCKSFEKKFISENYKNLCYFGDVSKNNEEYKKDLYIFTGFSQALMLIEASDALLMKKKAMGLWYNREYECEKLNPIMPNIWGTHSNYKVNSEKIENCNNLDKVLKTFIKENFKEYNIIMIYSNDWNNRLFGDGINSFFKSQNLIGGNLLSDKDLSIENFKLYLDNFNFSNARHIFINQIPNYKISPLSIFESDFRANKKSKTNLYAEPKKLNNFLKQELNSILNDKDFKIINPFDVFCDKKNSNKCLIMKDREFLYFDKEHLSVQGANILMERVLND